MSKKIIVHGRKTSSNVQTVMWAAAELGLEVERHDVGGAFGGTDTPDYRAMNPMGLVPTLQDGDVTLFESCAITRYLATQYGDESFWPTDPAKRADLDQWAEWAKGTLARTVIYEIFWTLVRTPKVERDMNVFATSVQTVGTMMTLLDTRLDGKAYLGGEDLSFADIIVGHLLYRYYTLDFDRAPTKNLDAYYNRLTQRTAYADHVMVDYSSLQVD